MTHSSPTPRTRFPVLAGLSLLGLAALAFPARGPRATPIPTLAQSPAASAGTCIWWNEDLARIKGIDGLWSTITTGEFVVLRPERDTDCSVTLVDVLTGEVHTYGFDRSGEVVLANGWIMLNQRDHQTLGGEAEDFGPACDPTTDALSDTPQVSKHAVSWIEWGPATWRRDNSVFAGDPNAKPEPILGLYLVDVPAEGAFIRYQTKRGEILRVPAEGGMFPDEQRFRQVHYRNSERTVLLFCTPQ